MAKHFSKLQVDVAVRVKGAGAVANLSNATQKLKQVEEVCFFFLVIINNWQVSDWQGEETTNRLSFNLLSDVSHISH